MSWTAEDIPSLEGRTAIVTGANSGTGYATARGLALNGASVVLACRNQARGTLAARRILRSVPGADLRAEPLDLASLGSVRSFAARIQALGIVPDLVVNNAGVMIPPQMKTADGFELQIGVNHLGHFALTGLLIPTMLDSPGSRVVTVSSIAHQTGHIDFTSFRGGGSYDAFQAYRQSKLANLIFAIELDRRLRAGSHRAISVAAHPGVTHTNLVRHRKVFDIMARIIGMPPSRGALPILFAATAPDVRGGEYYGPNGLYEMRGHPAPARGAPRARDPELAQRLWKISEELTGVHYLDPGPC